MASRERDCWCRVGRGCHVDAAVGLVVRKCHPDELLDFLRSDSPSSPVLLALHDHLPPFRVAARNVGSEITGPPGDLHLRVAGFSQEVGDGSLESLWRQEQKRSQLTNPKLQRRAPSECTSQPFEHARSLPDVAVARQHRDQVAASSSPFCGQLVKELGRIDAGQRLDRRGEPSPRRWPRGPA